MRDALYGLGGLQLIGYGLATAYGHGQTTVLHETRKVVVDGALSIVECEREARNALTEIVSAALAGMSPGRPPSEA